MMASAAEYNAAKDVLAANGPQNLKTIAGYENNRFLIKYSELLLNIITPNMY
jgi:hypothetical protein